VDVPKSSVEVTDAEIDEEIGREREKNARTITVEDRPAQNGDIVTLNYAGTVDGAAFDGDTAENQTLTLGSGTFIPGFEDQLVGAGVGSHVDVNVTFPEDYNEKSLAGKAAVFACDILKIETKELPELDDDFAQDVSEANTFDEYRGIVRENIRKRKEDQAKAVKEDAAINAVIKNAQMDIPEAMIEFQIDNMVDDFSRQMQMQGLNMEQYFQITGQSMDAMRSQMRVNALQRIQSRLVLEKVAEAENIAVSDEEVDEELGKMAASYGMTAQDVKESFDEKQIDTLKKDIAVRKAADFITEQAAEKEDMPAAE